MIHSAGGARGWQYALALQAECWATGAGESDQGERVPADWENDGGAREEDFTELKLCLLDFAPWSQS